MPPLQLQGAGEPLAPHQRLKPLPTIGDKGGDLHHHGVLVPVKLLLAGGVRGGGVRGGIRVVLRGVLGVGC